MQLKKTFVQELKKVINFASLLFIPFIILLLFGRFYIIDNNNFFREVLAFIFQTCVLLVVISFIRHFKLKKYLYYFSLTLLTCLVFLKLSFYSLYDTKLSASALFIIFETNSIEVVEFLLDFLSMKIIMLFIFSFTFLVVSFKIMFSKTKISGIFEDIKFIFFESKIIKSIIVVCFFATILIINKWFFQENIIYSSVLSYKDYQITKSLFKETLSKKENENLHIDSSLKVPQVYVVIVGESTSQKHMQLYGYNRNTNPLLTEIKEDLFVFKNVVAPHTHTLASLQKVLTLDSATFTDNTKNASIVQLANQAGFKTYWLSNQRPIGINETLPTQVAYASDKKYFINADDYMYTAFDGELLPYLDEILEDTSSNKKVIFIHLMGTHGVYKRRYPSEYNIFKGVNPITKFKHNKSKRLVNEYDNAILYNDMVVRNVIDKVKSKQTRSYVVYFSDHGEELYDNMDSSGHNEYYGTKSMYEVPLVLWLSDKYKQDRPGFLSDHLIENRKYNLENFIYSFADLSEIEFMEQNFSKSVFSKQFKLTKSLLNNKHD